MKRRDLIVAPLAIAIPRPASAKTCKAIRNFIEITKQDITSIDTWVTGPGAKFVADAEIELEKLKSKASSANAHVEDAVISEIWGGLAVTQALVFASVGVLFAPPAVPFFLVGMGVSATMLIVQIATAPKSFDAVDYAVVESAAKYEFVADSYADQAATAFKAGAGKLAAKAFQFFAIGWTIQGYFKAANKTDDAKKALEELVAKVAALQGDIQAWKQPGNLRAMRMEQLTLTLGRLEANLKICESGVDLPGPG